MSEAEAVSHFVFGIMEEAARFPQEATLTGVQFGLAASSREIVSVAGRMK